MQGNLSAYRIFYTVAQKGNISYAAKELYISQPAISKAIAKLEENLGASLFYRSSRGVVLTEEGKQLYEHTKKAFEEFEEGEATIRKMQEFGIGQIRIGVSTTLCKYVLIPYLKAFIDKYPHIKITITCQSTFHTVKLLEEEKIDVGLIGKFGFGKDILFYPVKEIEDVFVTTKGYLKNLSLREKEQKNTFDILSCANLLLLDEENISRRHIETYFKENHLEVKQVLEVGSMDLLIEFAKIGLGVACVIKEFVESEIKVGELSIVAIPKPIERREIGFAFSRKNIKTEAMDRFIEFVHEKK